MSSEGNNTQTNNTRSITTCLTLPAQMHSSTTWGRDGPVLPLKPLPMLELQMCLVFFGTLSCHFFLRRIGIPRFTSMCIVGIIIATRFNEAWDANRKNLFSAESQQSLGILSVFGYILFLFYIGVKTDLDTIFTTKRGATAIGAVALLAPVLAGLSVMMFYTLRNHEDRKHANQYAIIVGLASLTPFPVISSVLNELKILNSELGRLGLSAALISEMLSLTLISGLTIFGMAWRSSVTTSLISVGAAIFFLCFVWFVLRPAMFWIIRQTPEGSPVNDHYVYCVLIIALFSSYASHQFGFHAIFGAYMVGLAVPAGPPLGSSLIIKIDTFVNGVMMPLFVTVCALKMDLKAVMISTEGTDQMMRHTKIILVVTYATKFVGCMIPPLYRRMPLNDAFSISFIMNCKGIVDLAACAFVTNKAGMPNNVTAWLVLSIMISATAMPMLLKFFYDPMKKYAGYKKRNIIDLRANAELRVLTCIHRQDNIPPVINLLEAAYPSKEEPLCAYVLHLIELIGRAAPLFISHQLRQKKATDPMSSLSDNLLDAFHNFEQEFTGTLAVSTFTAVSPPEMMYDDICTLALDKLASLIILPFHQKWSSDGNSIELEDETIRDLNYRVLERAPCSVGILIERAQITHIFSPETPYSVCLLFIGGKDDREAFFFAKRMTKNPHVRLTVIRFVAAAAAHGAEQWEDMVDTELLSNVKTKNRLGDAYVNYVEEVVKDGPETALIVRDLVAEYNLIIVGRQEGIEVPQTRGLLQWSVFPELGALGDLLASTDAAGKASVVVMQHQKTAMDI